MLAFRIKREHRLTVGRAEPIDLLEVRLHRAPRPAGEGPANASPVVQAQRAKQQSKQRGDDERARDKARDALLRVTVVVHELGPEEKER